MFIPVTLSYLKLGNRMFLFFALEVDTKYLLTSLLIRALCEMV